MHGIFKEMAFKTNNCVAEYAEDDEMMWTQ